MNLDKNELTVRAKELVKRGRPTKFKAEYSQQLLGYFSDGLGECAYREVVTKSGIQLVPNRMPTFQRFALSIGVCEFTLYRWSTEKDGDGELRHPEFSAAYARAKAAQMAYLLEAGMVGALNPSFAGLAMKNLHDWKDKLETENTHSGQIDLVAINDDLKKAEQQRLQWKEEADERIARYST